MKKGKLIVFSAPSGSGKTTIVTEILKQFQNIEFSISACSRSIRGLEVDRKDYYFLSIDEFKQKIDNNDFVEWEEVYPNSFYGTLKTELDRIWAKGNHVIFDVDVKGGLALKNQFGKQALAVFVMPPSIDELRNRLYSRSTDSPENIEKRINKAEYEISYSNQFDTIIVNDILEQSVNRAIIEVENFISQV